MNSHKLSRYFFVIIKWFVLSLVLVLSGCTTYHQSKYSTEYLRKLPSHYSPIKNGHIEYYRFGSGHPIILITGYVTDVSSWNREFLLTLAEQHQVIVLNNRNVGRSSVKPSHYESQDLANDIYQLIQALGLKKPAILGISMGGMIAQQLAVLHPDKIGQLILINTAIAGKEAVHPSAKIKNKMFAMPKNKLERFMVAVEIFFPASWRMRMAYALAMERFQPQNYKEIDAIAIMSQQRGLVMQWIKDNATAKKIAKLNLPVLILNGEADVVIPPINSVILARNIPHAQLTRWKEGGHAMIYQYPEQIADVINYFIAEMEYKKSHAN